MEYLRAKLQLPFAT